MQHFRNLLRAESFRKIAHVKTFRSTWNSYSTSMHADPVLYITLAIMSKFWPQNLFKPFHYYKIEYAYTSLSCCNWAMQNYWDKRLSLRTFPSQIFLPVHTPAPDIGPFPFKHRKLPTRLRTASPQCYDKKYDDNEMLNNHQVECGRLP
jgi:hypothetical protein